MDDLNQYLVFYSWQSDCADSRATIKQALNTAKKVLAKGDQSVELIIDEGTTRVPGMPQIDTTILAKIKSCDVFVADITPVHIEGDDLLPNPNVLLELGFAMGVIGMSRIILLAKEGAWNPKDLPFDINHKRIDFFKDGNDLKGLSEWIRLSIDTAKESCESDDRKRRIEHDINKFKEFDKVWSEGVFLCSFDTVSRSCLFTDYELDIWNDVNDWLAKSENLFVTVSIRQAAEELFKALNSFLQFTGKYWSASVRRWCPDIPENEKDAIRIKSQRYYEWQPYGPKYSSFYLKREKIVVEGLNKHIPLIEKAYHSFRGAVKDELYV